MSRIPASRNCPPSSPLRLHTDRVAMASRALFQSLYGGITANWYKDAIYFGDDKPRGAVLGGYARKRNAYTSASLSWKRSLTGLPARLDTSEPPSHRATPSISSPNISG